MNPGSIYDTNSASILLGFGQGSLPDAWKEHGLVREAPAESQRFLLVPSLSLISSVFLNVRSSCSMS